MSEGLLVEITHSGLTNTSILLSDLEPPETSNLLKTPGPIYVPFGTTIELVYTAVVANSFESGVIRGFMNSGHLTGQVIFGTSMAAAVVAAVPAGVFEVDSVNDEIQPSTGNLDKGFIVGSTSMEDIGPTGDNRMFFDKANGSFRAGTATGAQWDAANRGAYSSAIGWNATASGESSHAIGTNTNVLGDYGVAIGHGSGTYYSVVPSDSPGSVALGTLAVTYGKGNMAIGYNSFINDGPSYSLALGYKAWVKAPAVWYGTVLGGAKNTSLATGATAFAGKDNTASGEYSIAGGVGSTTSINAPGSVALGYQCATTAENSTAMGSYTTASGSLSTALGYKTQADGWGSTAMGTYTYAKADASSAIGYASYTWMWGQLSRSSYSTYNVKGDKQESWVDASVGTTTAASSKMLIRNTSHGVTLPTARTWLFVIRVVARQTAGASGTVGDSATFEIKGAIKKIATTVTLLGSTTTTVFADAAAAGWTAVADANDTNDELRVTVTGEANKTITWVGFSHLFEVG